MSTPAPDVLHQVIQEGHSVVMAVTFEPRRVESVLADLLNKANRPLLRLSSSLTGEGGIGPKRLQALKHLASAESGSVLLVPDGDQALKDGDVVAALRELLPLLEDSGSALWLVGSTAEVPLSLSREVHVVEVPLPNHGELEEIGTQVLHASGVTVSAEFLGQAASAARGFTAREWRRLFEQEVHKGQPLGPATLQVIQGEKSRLLRSSAYLELDAEPETPNALGGLHALKEWLEGRSRAFSPAAREFGLPEPKGLLLLGVQGCGKSLSAKVIASLWNLPLARLDLGQLFRSHGAPEEALRQTLTLAESLAPLVLWIDEIDKTFHGVGESGSDTLRRLFGTLITWLQEKQAPVFVVATANQVDSLPPELLRKGRFDELFFVDLPDRAERESIFQIHLEKHGRAPSSFDLTRLSENSEHFSGAEIAECVVGALYLAFAEERDLQQSDLLRVVQETVPLYFTYEERIKELREWAKSRARNASRDTSLLELFETQQS